MSGTKVPVLSPNPGIPDNEFRWLTWMQIHQIISDVDIENTLLRAEDRQRDEMDHKASLSDDSFCM